MSDKENKAIVSDYEQSVKDYTEDIKNFEEEKIPKRPKRTHEEVSLGGQSTGSYCNTLQTPKKFDIKKFKLIKTAKQEIDLSTEDGKYQKKQEELAARRKNCTEICINNISDVREFAENFKVIY
jgi:hypothetical protein